MENTPNREPAITSDLIAGLTASFPSVPDVMASGVLASINPICDLCGLMVGTRIATLFTRVWFISRRNHATHN